MLCRYVYTWVPGPAEARSVGSPCSWSFRWLWFILYGCSGLNLCTLPNLSMPGLPMDENKNIRIEILFFFFTGCNRVLSCDAITQEARNLRPACNPVTGDKTKKEQNQTNKQLTPQNHVYFADGALVKISVIHFLNKLKKLDFPTPRHGPFPVWF